MKESTDDAQLDETVSALIDGELSAQEQTRALDRITRSAELQARWARYHAIRAVLSRDGNPRPASGLARRISQHIAGESVAMPAPWRRARAGVSWRPPVPGLALAGVAALAMLGGVALYQAQQTMEETGPSTLARESVSTAMIPRDEIQAVPGQDEFNAGGLTPELERRLGVYLVNHSEFAARGDLPGLMPYTRVAGYNAVGR